MENEIMYIKLDDIIPNRFQPREVFEESALQKLADSIRQHGVIEPIIVRPISNKYEIIAGERRYKASVLAGLTKIPAIVKPMDDKESSIVAYIENEHRSDVSAIEEARTIDRILKSNNMTQEELAKEIGINQSTLANKLRLLSLPPEIQDALMHNEISERHARSLLSVKDTTKQLELLDKIKKSKMTVRELDSEIKNMNNNVDNNLNNNFNPGFNPNVNMFNQPSVGNMSTNFGPSPAPMDNAFNVPFPPIDSAPTSNPVNDVNSFTNSTPAPTGFGFDSFPPNDSAPASNPVNDFSQYLNTPVADVPSNAPIPAPVADTPVVNEASSSPADPGFMNFLNDYKTDIPTSTPAPVENTVPQSSVANDNFMNYFDNYNTSASTAPVADTPVANEAPSAPADPGFMNFLNNYDINNPLPPEDVVPPEDNGEASGGTGLNIGNYMNGAIPAPSIAPEPSNNVTLNDVTPPITAPMDANSYVENSEQYVDVSKASVLGSVDEIINKVKVVVDDIKATSKYKIDTDEINYDDIYQITIRIDKRDF